MKRYKLKKDALTVKAGTIFEEEGNSDNKRLVQVTQDWCLIRPEIAIRNILNFDDWFEEIPENKRWRAEYNGGYYYIEDGGNVMDSDDYEDEEDDYRYDTGNYGRTKKELEVKREYNIARQVLIDDAKGGKWKKNGINLCVYYENGINRWTFDNTIRDIQISGAIYFQNRADTQKSLEEHKEQWEIVRKYEMGEM